jgi:hypothetical protein
MRRPQGRPPSSCHAGDMSADLSGAADEPWLAIGLDLQLSTTSEGGRQTPVLFGEPLRYRPDWGSPR